MDPRWHRRLRLGALLILAVLAVWPEASAPAPDDATGPIAVSAQPGE